MALATKVHHPKVEVLYNTGKIVALNYYGAMRAAEIPQLVARSCHGCSRASHAVRHQEGLSLFSRMEDGQIC